MGILFADVVHYTQIREQAIPDFVRRFMHPIGSLLRRQPRAPLCANTWGDAVYAAFDSVEGAGRFAVELANWVTARRAQWHRVGLPPQLSLRIALHAGLAYRVRDPIQNAPSYTGRHVSLAARIEPVTPPGFVYASESFAAIATALGARSFRCDYVGRLPLAKQFGEFPIYLVRRAMPAPRR